jgi:hemerythrin-like domain-containing protein
VLRDKNLIPLSHQHQHALALCVRMERASPIPDNALNEWQDEIAMLSRAEIAIHFEAEERLVFPAARRFAELNSLVEDLLLDHHDLRKAFEMAEAQAMSPADLLNFSSRLSAHIRKEERQLFERLQELLSHEELDRMGSELSEALKDASQSCAIPNEATKLRPAK